MICGGLALNIYGIPRMTIDIDLLLDLTKENIDAFQKTLDKLRYKPRLPLDLKKLADKNVRADYIKNKNLIAFSYYNQNNKFVQLDVLLDTPLTFAEMWKDKYAKKVNGFSLYLASVDHLIKMKKYSDRIQDRDDILLLTKFKKKKLF